MPTLINQQENKYNVCFCDRRKISLKQILLRRPALGLPQLLQHLCHCGVAGSFCYALSAKIQIPKWQGKLKRKNSCWWDSSEYATGLSKIKLNGKGKQSISSFSFEKNLHGHRLANGFIHQFTKPVIHSTVTVSCLSDPNAGSAFPKGLMH